MKNTLANFKVIESTGVELSIEKTVQLLEQVFGIGAYLSGPSQSRLHPLLPLPRSTRKSKNSVVFVLRRKQRSNGNVNWKSNSS